MSEEKAISCIVFNPLFQPRSVLLAFGLRGRLFVLARFCGYGTLIILKVFALYAFRPIQTHELNSVVVVSSLKENHIHRLIIPAVHGLVDPLQKANHISFNGPLRCYSEGPLVFLIPLTPFVSSTRARTSV